MEFCELDPYTGNLYAARPKEHFATCAEGSLGTLRALEIEMPITAGSLSDERIPLTGQNDRVQDIMQLNSDFDDCFGGPNG